MTTDTGQRRPSTAPIDDVSVRVRGLTKDFPLGGLFSRRSMRAVDNVDFDIPRGTIVALVGESGSGKSTVARALARLERPTAGSIVVGGRDVLKTEKSAASRRYRGTVQMVFQDPFGSLNPAHRVEHFLERPLRIHGKARSRQEVRRRSAELMRTVGLTEDMLDSYPHELSGGQRQRVSIARALAVDPEIILADEPTSMLDVSVRIGILNLMARLRDERGISMLFITHDLASARYVADTTLVMFAGALVEGGESLELMKNPSHPYTQLLLSAVPDPARTVRYDPHQRALLRRAVLAPTACPWQGPDCSATVPVRHTIGPDHWVRCHLYAPQVSAAANPLLTDSDAQPDLDSAPDLDVAPAPTRKATR
ncbi:ABC transporter ATP-binding protein [Cryobacterium lactosi]|uniref:ABC transporter ATP-binding protein n=1 Tax=Cryobacterium lactosi TaxID=1259202 RepID=A0A4R9BH54_9MICO|nr:ATP-binding cassette domain-containing protein [Cryobacterium lactosi]TFD84512.1 ABC transporter ATP-binding protein [Cryobacterium lactosi]